MVSYEFLWMRRTHDCIYLNAYYYVLFSGRVRIGFGVRLVMPRICTTFRRHYTVCHIWQTCDHNIVVVSVYADKKCFFCVKQDIDSIHRLRRLSLLN